MSKLYFKTLLEKSRFFTVLYENLPLDIKANALYETCESYFVRYAYLNNISIEMAVECYTNFISAYNKHCKEFVKTGKYPYENNSKEFIISREEYDIVLLLSVLFTGHRFRIMQLVSEYNPAEKALFIGLGPGLDLYLNKENYKEIHGYDIAVNKFLYSEFPNANLKAELYTGQKSNYFDAIYLIELLEHLNDPFSLLQVCHDSLQVGGKIFFTTATDIPQFDHLFNFSEDHSQFEKEISEMGFSILYKEMIPHDYLKIEIKPCNHFYIVKKI